MLISKLKNMLKKIVKETSINKTDDFILSEIETKRLQLHSLVNQDNFDTFLNELYINFYSAINELIYTDSKEINKILEIKGKIAQSYNNIFVIENSVNEVKKEDMTKQGMSFEDLNNLYKNQELEIETRRVR